MKRINLYEAKTHLSKWVAAVEETGESIVLCRSGRPVADLVPHKETTPELTPDPVLKGAKFKVDPCQSLPEEDWPSHLR